MDTVVGLGRHKRFLLTQNPLTGAGFLSRASHGSVVMLAVVFRSLARPEWTFQAQEFQTRSVIKEKKKKKRDKPVRKTVLNHSVEKQTQAYRFFTASCLVLAWS